MDHIEKSHQKESYISASKMSNCTLKYLFKGTGTHFANVKGTGTHYANAGSEEKNRHPLKIHPFGPNSVLGYAHRILIDFDRLCMNTYDRRISALEFLLCSFLLGSNAKFLFSISTSDWNIHLTLDRNFLELI